MAVIPTGAIYKALIFDGESSRNYGVYITGEAVYNSPVRDVEMIKIPGRNGEFALDNGRFENIEVTYPAGIFADNEAYFAEAISDFRNFLASRVGYCRLEDEYNPNEYRMAVYKSGLNVDPAKLEAGEFSITFDCKPQRWLKDGETAVAIGEWGETETASGDIVTVENPNGILAVKSLEVDLEPIQDLNGYDKPWVGGAGKNKLPTGESLTYNGITFTVRSDGSVNVNGTATANSSLYFVNLGTNALAPYLTSGTQYIVSGCPSGGSGSTYSLQIEVNGSWKTDLGSGVSFTYTSGGEDRAQIYIASGTTISNKVFYPMIRLASETDATYEPYENICPISGHTSVDIVRIGANLLNIGTLQSGFITPIGEIARADAERQEVYSDYMPITSGTAYTLSVTVDNAEAKWSALALYDSNKNFIRRTAGFTGTGTTVPATLSSENTTGVSYVRATYRTYGIAKNVYFTKSAETDTYTTALGRTVYGGTLDVTSGVLTVDRAFATYDGSSDENWMFTTYGRTFRAYIAVSDIDTTTSDSSIADIVSNQFSAISYERGQANAGISARFNIAQINVFQNEYTTLEEWKNYLASNPLQVVYELATPQTYQLTAQQISLLLGDNNIWSDSGDITLEYGQNPSVLFNPTLFESSPLLETAGSGSIQFNGYEIDFEGVPIGEVVVCPDAHTSSSSNPATLSVPLDTSLLNEGDLIYPATKGFRISAQFVVSNARYKFTSASVTSTTNVLDASAYISAKKTGLYCYLWPDFGNGFAYGTAETITCLASYNYAVDGGALYTEQVQVTIAYDGADTITVTVSRTGTVDSKAQRSFNGINQAVFYGDSSKPNNDPIFIDCDLGEAYTNEGGVYRSLNQYIDLGSELPTLGIGANEVTFDNTITELKITPRWWKV